jgi:hypothetical protein
VLLLFFGGPNWILLSYVGVLAWVPLGALCLWTVATGRLNPPARRPLAAGNAD